MVAKKLLAVFLGLFLISFVSAAWSVEITSPDNNSSHDSKITKMDVNITENNLTNCWWSDGSNNRSFDCEDGTISSNVSSDEDWNVWNVYANDTSGTIKSDSVSFWVDSVAPNLTYVQPWGSMYFTNQDSFDFQFRLDEANKGDYPSASFSPFLLRVFDPYGANFESPNLENLSSTEETLSEIKNVEPSEGNLDEGAYTWIAFSKDIFPNGNTIREVNITGTIVRDVTDPNVWFNAPVNNSNVSGFVWVNASASDANFPKNITLNLSNSTDNYLVYYCEFSVDCNSHGNTTGFADGQYTITATAYDKAENTNSTSRIINIDNHAPVVNIIYPVNGTSYSIVDELNYTVIEAHPDTCWFESNYVDSGENFTGLGINASEGINNWTVYCNDTSGNVGSDSVEFVIDNTAPDVTINTPFSQIFNTNSIFFNISVNDYSSIDSCLLELNENQNYSMTQNGVDWNYENNSMRQGNHTAKFYCNDSLGNLNDSEEVSFFIDSINPIVNVVSPSNASEHNVTDISINYTYDELNPNTCWYTNNAGANTTITCGENITNETWTEGWNTVIVWMNDIAGNVNSSSVTFLVDSIVPEINILSPANNSYSNDAELNITYNLTEANPDTCWYNVDSGANTTITCGENIINETWTEGEHNISIWANDTLGHESSLQISFTIDTTAPTINFTNGTEADGATVDEDSVYINVTANDSNEDSIVFNLYNSDGTLKDSIVYFTGAREHTFTGLNNGLYYYNVTINDSAGNLEHTGTRNITVDKPDTNKNPSGGSSSGSRSSCVRVWNCSKWGRWSVCNDEGIQYRSCSEMERVGCGEGLEKDELENLVQNQSCSLKIVQEESGSDEDAELVSPNPEDGESEDSTSGITGAVVGFAKSGTGILTIGAIVALLGAWGAIHYNRRKKLKTN